MKFMAKNNLLNFYLLLVLLFQPCLTTHAQNRIETVDKRTHRTNITYYDGLGRPYQEEVLGLNGSGEGVYTQTDYDKMGREKRKWLPLVGPKRKTSVSSYSLRSLSSATYSDNYAYRETDYDALGRPVSVSVPGQAAHVNGACEKMTYLTNAENSVKRYVLSSTSSVIKQQGYYPAESLTAIRKTDADGRTTEVYKNLLEQVVLERRNGNNDTYYVYEGEQLRVVIPPLYQETSEKSLLYRYFYDDYGRCKEKILPGNVSNCYWYDRYGRISFLQDARLLQNGQFRFYLYDGLNRLAIQGLTSDTLGKCSPSYTARVEMGNHGDSGIGGSGYISISNTSFSSVTLEQVNYYDGYTCLSLPAFSTVSHDVKPSSLVCTTTLLTAQMLSTSQGGRMYRIYEYDRNANQTAAYEYRSDGNLVQTHTDYSLSDHPIRTRITLEKDGQELTFQDSVSYDTLTDLIAERDLLLPTGRQVRTDSYVYDKLGRMAQCANHNWALTTSYSYDLQNRLLSIQSTNQKNGSQPFFEALTYSHQGNILESHWSSGDYPDGERMYLGYRYSYDGLNRLLSAHTILGSLDYSGSSIQTRHRDVEISYDSNGSITRLHRMGKLNVRDSVGLVDDITCLYRDNRLFSVSDASPKTVYDGASDFVDNTLLPQEGNAPEYEYDGCGAMTKDLNKGIIRMEYTLQGQPSRFLFHDGSQTEYDYAADGTRLKVRHTTVVPNLTSVSDSFSSEASSIPLSLSSENILSVDSTEYFGNIVFENGRFSRYYYSSGYVQPYGRDYACRYFLRDHLGNVRVVASSSGKLLQTTHYYPYGITLPSSTQQDIQRLKYNGKELDRMYGLDLYDYVARQYDAPLGRFTSMDPLCEKYYHLSPYAYCGDNPINAIDPDGNSTWVISQGDGKYKVVGGNLFDSDKNIYVGDYIKGSFKPSYSLGISTSITSFYNSDISAWENCEIDTNDKSDDIFLSRLFNHLPPMFDDYMLNARMNKPYDFKNTNGTLHSIKNINHYRGMPIGVNGKGQVIYSSARDIGNIAAGFVAASNGMSWLASRLAFDFYQRGVEGISTRNAEYYGWVLGYSNTSNSKQKSNFENSISSLFFSILSFFNVK